MRIHSLQHVPFEGLGHIGHWLEHTEHTLSSTLLYQNAELPDLECFDMLVIMGGPMGIYDDEHYPWLMAERQFIKRAIESGKPVLGVCLGSQFIADALGAAVYPNTAKEIGWFELERTEDAQESNFGQLLPARFSALHWHGDTFDLPQDCVRLLSSEACLNQAFSYDNRLLALQFHLEMTPLSTSNIVNACAHELVTEGFIQDAETINSEKKYYKPSQDLMEKLLIQLTHHTQ